MILSKALKSARAFRSAKNRAVCKAETFSATAVATNWLMLVPSSRLSLSTASFNDRGSRRGYVLFPSSYDPRYRFPCEQEFHAEPPWYVSEIPLVECHQGVRPAIDRRLQNHFIPAITELRSPQKMGFHGLRHGNHSVHKNTHFSFRQPGG